MHQKKKIALVIASTNGPLGPARDKRDVWTRPRTYKDLEIDHFRINLESRKVDASVDSDTILQLISRNFGHANCEVGSLGWLGIWEL
jgi:hypothetical protein